MNDDVLYKIAQRRGLFQKFKEKINLKRKLTESFSDVYKEHMQLLREVDDDIREHVADIKKYEKLMRKALKDKKYLDTIHFIGNINDSLKLIASEYKKLNDIRGANIDEFFGESEYADLNRNYFNNTASIKEAGIFDFFLSDRERAGKLLEKMYRNQLKARNRAMIALVNKTSNIVEVTLETLKLLGDARSSGDINTYLKALEQLESKRILFENLFKTTYTEHIKPMIDRMHASKKEVAELPEKDIEVKENDIEVEDNVQESKTIDVINLINNMGPQSLLNYTHHKNPEVRKVVAEKIPADHLKDMVNDTSKRVREVVAIRTVLEAPDLIPILIKDKEPSVRALLITKNLPIEFLSKMIDDEDENIRILVASIIPIEFFPYMMNKATDAVKNILSNRIRAVEKPVEPPVKAPPENPVEPPVKAPVETPVETPTEESIYEKPTLEYTKPVQQSTVSTPFSQTVKQNKLKNQLVKNSLMKESLILKYLQASEMYDLMNKPEESIKCLKLIEKMIK